ncbi:zinc finger protein 184-like [Anastrepha obliqua]|uniref:zinc finger protein 184-like n=1 Tax=Anastrepha obliqua TaxID=95512 RepID=UPI00240A55C7|nr:zinc finger protein 184-like [Anastrepha obliqua]
MPLYCRFCLKRNPSNFSVYSYMRKKYLPRVIFHISGVQVSIEEEPDAQICNRCAVSVLVAQNIILRIQESEEYFQFQRVKASVPQWQSPITTTKNFDPNVGELLSNDYEESNSISHWSIAEESSNNQRSELDISHHDSKIQTVTLNISEKIDRCMSSHELESKRIKSVGVASVIFNCEECDYSTKIGKRIIEHKQTEHGVYDPNIYSCNLCSQSFSWKPTLYRHIELDHKTLPADKKYLCNECGRAYMREVHLLEHIKQRHRPRNFKCPDPLCEQSFTRTFTLRRHFITSHTEHTSTRYHCIDCDKYFKVYDQWKYHNQVIHKNETVYCPHCGYPFRFKEKLEEHLLKDVCKRSVVPCSYCQRRFTTKTGLREHVRNIHNIY